VKNLNKTKIMLAVIFLIYIISIILGSNISIVELFFLALIAFLYFKIEKLQKKGIK